MQYFLLSEVCYTKKTIEDSFDAFVHSLLGGFVGTIIEFIRGYVISLIIPHDEILAANYLALF
ncbi:MAG: hypothetical protein AAGE84_03565 [Cyanobacteria bacterium P01_G01_bin.39]